MYIHFGQRYSIFRVKCSRHCLSFSELGIQRLQKIQVVLLLQQQVINPDIVGQVPCVGAFSVDCPSLQRSAQEQGKRTLGKRSFYQSFILTFEAHLIPLISFPNF